MTGCPSSNRRNKRKRLEEERFFWLLARFDLLISTHTVNLLFCWRLEHMSCVTLLVCVLTFVLGDKMLRWGVWVWERVETKERGGRDRKWERAHTRSKNSMLVFLFFFNNRYSPVLVQALCWERHLHRDRRGGVPVHLSPRLHGGKLRPEERTVSHQRVPAPFIWPSILSKGILYSFISIANH